MSIVRRHFLLLFFLLSLGICLSSSFAKKRPAKSVKEADDCSLSFKGKERRSVKLRTIDESSTYEIVNNGTSISVAMWHTLVCRLDKEVVREVPETGAIMGVETKKVSIEAYLLAAKFKADEDHDIHAEISDSPKWNSDHIIIEVPPGEEYCKPRKALWSIIKNDNALLDNDEKILEKPVKIRATGYIFLDAKSGFTDRCNSHGGRGLKYGKHAKSNVIGLYELHPVIELQRVE